MKKEPLLSINQFNMPDHVNGVDADGYNLAVLLVMRTGSNPMFPNMGFNLTKYAFNELEDDLSKIGSDFKQHASIYLPEVTVIDIVATTPNDNKMLLNLLYQNNSVGEEKNIIFQVKNENSYLLVDILN